MKTIKKLAVLVMALVMMFGCVSEATAFAATSTSYSFKSKGVTITPGKNAKKFINANKDYYVSKSNSKTCIASSGYDVTRVYKYFTITTYSKKKNGTGKLESISITNTSVNTPEGLKCGMAESEITKKYSDAKKFGSSYSTTKGKTKIVITVSGGKVSEIEYLYTGSF